MALRIIVPSSWRLRRVCRAIRFIIDRLEIRGGKYGALCYMYTYGNKTMADTNNILQILQIK